MILILIGPPGSGKSTQSHLLVDMLQLPYISVGETIRNALKSGPFASFKQIVDEGNLLPDHIVFEIIKDKLAEINFKKGFIMEGFPRTLGQAEWLDKWLKNQNCAIDKVFYLNGMEHHTIKKRILSRHQCAHCGKIFTAQNNDAKIECPQCQGPVYDRIDDKEDALRNRIDQYHQQSAPVVEYYLNKSILRTIDATKSINEVFEHISEFIHQERPMEEKSLNHDFA